MTFKATICAASLALFAGCGGGGDGIGSQFSPIGSGPVTQSELRSLSDAFSDLSNISASDVSFSAPTANASYNGFVEIDQSITDYYLGRVALNANFSSDQISGQAGDFAIVRDTTPASATDISQTSFNTVDVLAGTLAISNGTIGTVSQNGETARTMNATMAGNLTGATGTYGFDTTLDGFFFSVAGQDAVGGLISGTKTEPGAGTSTLDGAFAAFR